MKKQTKSRLQISLQTLGIISLMFFAMAFACKDDKSGGGTDTGDGGRRDKSETTTSGGKCSTEEEFKELLVNNFSKTFNEYDGKFKETEVDFQKFDIGRPFRYKTSYPYIIDAENAYPAKVSYVSRDYLHESDPSIFEKRVTDNRYVFYIDHHGDCVFGLESGGTSETKTIPYNQ